MPKFQKKNVKPREAPATIPEEGAPREYAEAAVITPMETPVVQICGINGCTTYYENPIVMQRHRERVHGIGGEPNLNNPKPRNQNIKPA